MRAVVIGSHGGPEVVSVTTLPEPEPASGEVRVAVRTAALNHLDLWVRGGLPGLNLTFPHIMGSDCAGVIDQLGPDVEGFQVGDEVVFNPGISCGLCRHCRAGQQSQCIDFHLKGEHFGGTFCEYIAVPARNLAHRPQRLSWEASAAFPLVFLTAWRMLFSRARLSPSETVLIHGIGGGVSSACLQLAVRAGARAIVTSSSPEKLEQARSMGAFSGIDYREQDVTKEVLQMTSNQGVDVVVDSIGGRTWQISIKCARKGGRIVTCGATTGPTPKTDIARIFWKQLTILGSTMGSDEDWHEVVRYLGQTDIEPLIDRVYPLREAPAALARLEAGEQFGKIVLRVEE